MKHQATADLFHYWDALRGERSAPERNDIDPGAIRAVLADTFMLEFDAASRFPFRLAGTRVNGLFDADQKGRSFLDLWAAAERRNLVGVLLTVANGPCPVIAGATAAPGDLEPCPFELLLLPMRHHGKTHSRILGLIKPVLQPAWLGLVPPGPLHLHSLRMMDGAERPAPRTAAASAGPQQIAARLRKGGRRGPPLLQVIEGGRRATGLPVVGRLPERSDVFEVEVENGHL